MTAMDDGLVTAKSGNDSAWIAQRHGLDAHLADGLAATVKALMEQAAR